MTKEKIQNSLITMLTDVAPTIDISINNADEDFADLGYDSLDLSSFALEVETEFDVKIDDDELVKLSTINQFSEYLLAKIA